MKEAFLKYGKVHELFSIDTHVLLAVSGAKDSMVLLDLFRGCELNFAVAHCNFKLRGEDADADAEFVKAYCSTHQIAYFTKDFNTENYAKEHKLSIQMAARELRYDWFESLLTEHNFDRIATAHHKNDVAETMLINLTKGTGIAGLHGIANRIGNVIRPLLCFTRREIEEYVVSNAIVFREDASNSERKYLRNAIRHEVIPVLENLNPSAIQAFNNTAQHLKNIEQIVQEKVAEEMGRVVTKEEGTLSIEIGVLKQLSPMSTYLYYFLADYGFNASDVKDILNTLDHPSGRMFYSNSHVLLKDRNRLILEEKKEISLPPIEIQSVSHLNELDLFDVEVIDYEEKMNLNEGNDHAYIDLNLIQFPLILRNWQVGDAFQPLGMKGRKKLSDLFIDTKLDRISKAAVQVIEMNGDIIWVVNQRIDDRFKITNQTKQILHLKKK